MYHYSILYPQIFDSEKLQVREKITFADQISALEWSPDDQFIMAIISKKNQIQVRCMNPMEVLEGGKDQSGWYCKIEESVLGLAGWVWAPDSRQIITFSELQLRASVWSMVEQKAIAHIKNPKLLPPKGISFTKNRKFMALAERKEAKDWVSLYYTGQDWKMVNTFEVETFDLQDVMWCKEDTAVLVYDSPLESRILIYSAMTGECVAKHSPQPLGGAGLGLKSISLSPNGIFMIAAMFDSKLRIYNALSQKELAHLEQIT